MRKIKPKIDEYMEPSSVGLSKKKAKPHYPTIRLPLEHIPEAKDWEVSKEGEDKGKEYTLELKVRMVGLSQSRFDNTAEFEIREMGCEEMGEK